jgi:hypothetical protein
VVDDGYRAAQRVARCRSFERRFHHKELTHG